MIAESMVPEAEQAIQTRTAARFQDHRSKIYRETDRLFAFLLAIQWLAAIVIACVTTPLTWAGPNSSIHPHVWIAVFMCGTVSLAPIVLVLMQPGATFNRHVIAISQMLTASILIHITGGRIETHFHLFGSLAFLAFYRDWRVLITASLVAAADHLLRGAFWPASIYGVILSNPWRAIEHIVWVVFCDIFLIRACVRSRSEMLEIASREAKQDHLLYQAQHDALTGLPNRLQLATKLEQGVLTIRQSGGKLALLCIDLDRFKQVNDSLGHQIGDVLLQRVAHRLESNLRNGEQVVRTGGDEFAVTLAGIGSAQDATVVAARLVQCLTQPFVISGHEITIGASIGISMFPDHAEDTDGLQKNADIAMYRVKARGKNGFECFTPEMAAATLDRMDLEHQLSHALDRKELILHYQPKVDLQGDVAGFEALIRWAHPKLGLIPPAQFIPMAEETGMIVEIGEWVLNEACLQAAAWERSTGRALTMAVNVSAVQFRRPEFVETVQKALMSSEFAPHRLELEMTETFLMVDAPSTVSRMREIRALGVRIAMDDFGTGYSSLSYLHKLPVDVLKIDGSFIAGLDGECSTLPLVQSIIALAHNLKLSVVAEGVEQRWQADILKNLGCDWAQGYLFRRPLTPENAGLLIGSTSGSPHANDAEGTTSLSLCDC